MKRSHTAIAKAVLLLFGVVLIGQLFSTTDAQAIPAFARKYAVNCTVCHVRAPRLNRTGERFLENGYQLPGTEDGGILAKLKYGDLTLDQVSNYLGVLVQTNVVQHTELKRDVAGVGDQTEFGTPTSLRLFTAGTITNNVGFFVNLGARSSSDTARLGRAFVTLNNLGQHDLAHIRIGRFDPSAFSSFAVGRQLFSSSAAAFSGKFFGLFNRAGGRLRSSSPSLYNAFTQVGIDIHGRPFGNGFLYQVGIVNGADERAGDSNNSKDWYAMTRFDLADSDYFSANVSGFAYFGNHNAKVASGSDVSRSRYGFMANLRYMMVDLYGAFVVDRIADLPASLESTFDTTATGLTLEADVLATDRLVLGVRYDHLDAGGLRSQRISNSTLALLARYYLRSNVAIFLQDDINLRRTQGGSSPERNLRNEFLIGIYMAY